MRSGRSAVRLVPVAAATVDALLVVVALLGGVLVRRAAPFVDDPLRAGDRDWPVLVPVVAVWLLLLALLGAYRRQVFGVGTDEYKRVAHATVLAAAAVGIACYLLRHDLSRGLFVATFVLGAPLLVAGRYVLRLGIKAARRRGALQHRVVIAGAAAHVDEVAAVLGRERWLGYDVVGALTPEARDRTGAGVPVLGRPADIARVVAGHDVDTYFVAGGAYPSAAHMRQVFWDLEQLAVQVVVAPGVTDVAAERVSIRPVGGLPLVHLDPPRSLAAARWGKRAFDLVAATGLLVLLLPVLVVAAVRVRAHDGGPVLFRQARVGRDGVEFACLKLRTMVVDAEARLPALVAGSGHAEGLFKLPDDPRVTRPGAWLRRWSVDELPQLLNVLRGQMSLVGPRPPLPAEVAAYADHMHRRLRVRPGMTGLWQVSGRSNLSFDEAIRLDLYYVDNWSMVQDLVIVGRTFSAVLRGRGAY